MLQNLAFTQGRAMSESVMMALVHKGVNRQEAHEMLRKLTIQSAVAKQEFKETLKADPLVSSKLNAKEIEARPKPQKLFGHSS